MGMDFFLDVIRKSIMQGLIIVTPMLGVGIVIGLAISIVQSATSISEQTLTFVPKLLATALGIFILMPWMIHSMISYFHFIVELFPALSK